MSMPEKTPQALRAETLHSDDTHSYALIALRGSNHITVNRKTTVLYRVTAGEGYMYVDGVGHELKPGAIVEVPPRVPYYDEGMVDMEAFSVPAFDAADVETINEFEELLWANPLEWVRATIGAEAGRDGSWVSNYEIFKRYNEGGYKEWNLRAVRAVRELLLGIGVVNLHE